MCDKNSHGNHLYMHGLWRSGGIAGLNHLEYADCREDSLASTDKQCYNANWWGMYVRVKPRNQSNLGLTSNPVNPSFDQSNLGS